MNAGHLTRFARVDFRSDDRVFGIKDEDRLLHTYVIGKTGTGKSTLLEKMALQDMERGHGFAQLTVANWIAIVTTGVMTISLFLLVRQIAVQNKIAKASLLRDRFDMYWIALAPVTQNHIDDLHVHPADFLPLDTYERYRKDDGILKKYVFLARAFVYMAFCFYSKNLGIKDVFGEQWLPLWTADLAGHQEFLEIKDYYRPYYPEFSKFIDGIKKITANYA